MSAATARATTARDRSLRPIDGGGAPAVPRARSASPAPVPGQRPAVRLVSAGDVASGGTATFVASCAGLLAATLASLLALNVAVSGNAFTLAELSDDAARLQDAEELLGLAVAEEAAPQRLDARARALGMAPADVPLVLQVPGLPADDVPAAGDLPAVTAPADAGARG